MSTVAARGDDGLNAGRVWATCLTLASLKDNPEHILVEKCRGLRVTLADRSLAWLRGEAGKFRELEQYLEELLREARAVYIAWRAQHVRAAQPAAALLLLRRASAQCIFPNKRRRESPHLVRRPSEAAAKHNSSSNGRWCSHRYPPTLSFPLLRSPRSPS